MSTTRHHRAFTRHDRDWRTNRYVYPVISRRSKGLSIGVNLNPDKACNFDCIYCQVDRRTPPRVRTVDLGVLAAELEAMIQMAADGTLYQDLVFGQVPAELRRLNDIAFSGDGEPTTCPQFPAAVQLAADLRTRHQLAAVRLVLITDACYLTRPDVAAALAVMDRNHGEIWAKLDAGTEAYYRMINRPNVPLTQVLDNILAAARVRPLVIQTLFMNVHQQPPPTHEIAAFCDRLDHVVSQGGAIKLVQIYTIARQTAEPYVSPLTDTEIDDICHTVRTRTGLTVEAYY